MLRLKHKRKVTPIYRESGYAQRLRPTGAVAFWLQAALLLLGLLSLLLIWFARGHSRWVELFYSRGFYPLWAGMLSTVTSLLPVSLAEWLLILAVCVGVAAVVHLVIQLLRYRYQSGKVLARFALRLLSAAAAVLLLFTLSGGLNYYRYFFSDYSGLAVRPSDTAELVALCTELVEQANTQRTPLAEDTAGVATLAVRPDRDMARVANDCYRAMTANNPEWQSLFALSQRVRAKQVLFSEAMSYMQIVGFFFPFTIEANVNVHTSAFNIPNATCHELAHISGFMREDEANFIAYLACSAGSDPVFRYSGTMLALVHSTNALYGRDTAAYAAVMEQLSDPVRRDLLADAAYFDRYSTRFGDFASSVNDGYLRANNQADGVASYGRMVDLLLADYRLRHKLD